MRRSFRTLVPALACSVVLAACTGGGGHGSGATKSTAPSNVAGVGASKRLRQAADATEQAKTAMLSGQVTANTGGQPATLPINGAVDLKTGAFEFQFDLGSLGIPGAPGGTVEARFVDGVLYMNLGSVAGGSSGALSSELDGKSWMKLDLKSLSGKLGGSSGLESADPAGTLGSLRGVSDDVQRVGTEDVRGVPTTHYKVTIDPAKALESASGTGADRLRSALQGASSPIPADVWVDGSDRLRKISLQISTPNGSVNEELELYDFGTRVEVVAPPPDQTFDLSQMLGGLLPSGGSGASA